MCAVTKKMLTKLIGKRTTSRRYVFIVKCIIQCAIELIVYIVFG